MKTLGINEMVWIAEIIELDDSPEAVKQQKIANYMNCSFFKAGKLLERIKENLAEGKKFKY